MRTTFQSRTMILRGIFYVYRISKLHKEIDPNMSIKVKLKYSKTCMKEVINYTIFKKKVVCKEYSLRISLLAFQF